MIESFMTEENRWLSNMSPCKIELDGALYASTEHAYMSAKSNDPEWKSYCQTEPDPHKVKVKSKDIKLVKNWNTTKCSIMETVLRQKFNQEPYKSKLRSTGNQNIQEGNTWNDDYWGVDLKKVPNVGENLLGRLIMKIRDELKQGRLIQLQKESFSKNLFDENVVPEMEMNVTELQEVYNRYNLGLSVHTRESTRLMHVIICLENKIKEYEKQ